MDNNAVADRQDMKKLLEDLDALGGGGLVKRMRRSKIDGHTRVMFIGLGGMGCKTVNAIKGVWERDFEVSSASRISFFMVDTDVPSMNKLTRGEASADANAHMSAADRFAIFSNAASDLLIHRPEVVKQWLSDEVPSQPISNDGAQGRRVTGRIMLCGTGQYQALQTILRNRITALTAGMTASDKLSVVIVSGISGGTGSGTFVDVSYMVRMLLDNFTKFDSELYGVFFTPDVQAEVPEISANQATWSNLRRNGYAAMKELDYFINIGSHDPQTETVYSIRLPDGTKHDSHKTMFEKSKVYIISATETVTDCSEIIAQTASSLMNMFQTGSTSDGGNQSQSILSTLSNTQSMLQTWINQNVGKPDDENNVDPCGVRACRFPRFMNYNFASLGFRSIYFPRNEMVSYCANRAFLALYDKWNSANEEIDQQYVYDYAIQFGMGSVDAIYRAALPSLSLNLDFRIKKGETNYPIRKGFEKAGKVINVPDTIREADDRVTEKMQALATRGVTTDPTAAISNAVIAFLQNSEFAENYGPHGGMRLLVSAPGGGLCGVLKSFIDSLPQIIEAKFTAAEVANSNMVQEGNRLASDKTPHDAEVETLVDRCEEYSDAKFEYEFYSAYMEEILTNLYNTLMQYNNETFEIYVPIMEAVEGLLEKDSDIFAKSTLRRTGNTTTFNLGLNAMSMNHARQMGEQFERMFNGYVDAQGTEPMAKAFADSLLSENTKKIWAAFSKQPDKLADELRRVFSVITGPLINNMLEKLMVLIYCDPTSVAGAIGHEGDPTIEDLDKLWEHEDLRASALSSAASQIVSELLGSKMIRFSTDPNENADFPNLMSVVLLSETPNLNAAIVAELSAKTFGHMPSVVYLGENANAPCEYKTAITMAMSVSPFPLAMVYGMKDYAEQYFVAEQSANTSAGRHLDEVDGEWQTYLPEIYGDDAETFFADRRSVRRIENSMRAVHNNKPVNHDHEIYEALRTATEYGLEKGYIKLGSVTGQNPKHYYLILPSPFNSETLSRISEKMMELGASDSSATLSDALQAIEADSYEKLYVEYCLSDGMDAQTIKSAETATPRNPRELKNLYRLIRAKMTSTRRVLEAMKKFEGSNFFFDLDNLRKLEFVVKRFGRAYNLGMIGHELLNGWYCRYSDIDEPLYFLDDSAKTELENLDTPFRWYLVISAFSRIAEHPFLEKVDQQFEALKKTWNIRSKAKEQGIEVPVSNAPDPMSCMEILNALEAGFQIEVLRKVDKAAAAKEIEKALRRSNFFDIEKVENDYYSFPRRCGGKADIVLSNITLVKDCLKELIPHDVY